MVWSLSAVYAVEREIFRMRAAWVTVAPSLVMRCSWRSSAGPTARAGRCVSCRAAWCRQPGGGWRRCLAWRSARSSSSYSAAAASTAKHEPAFLGVQVEVLGQRPDRDAAVAQLADGGQQVRRGASPPVRLPEHQGAAIIIADGGRGLVQAGPGAAGPSQPLVQVDVAGGTPSAARATSSARYETGRNRGEGQAASSAGG